MSSTGRFRIHITNSAGEAVEFLVEVGEYRISSDESADLRLPETDNWFLSLGIVIDSGGCAITQADNNPNFDQARQLADETGTFHNFPACTEVLGFELTVDLTDTDGDLDKRIDSLEPNSSTSYQVEEKIASGGMGNVFRANDSSLGRNVAMKVMRVTGSDSRNARRRFLREAMVLGRLEHPNIVPIHDFGRDSDGRLYYTMKLVRGDTLRTLLRKIRQGDADALKRYPLDRLLDDFRKICDAVAFAHSRGVIHRDLKPDNIMIGEFGEVLVMDWGLAKILGESPADEESEQIEGFTDFSSQELIDLRATLTLAGSIVGTPQYMPPEQAEGRNEDVREHSDIFALGGILYSILTLRPPVTGKSLKEVVSKVRAGDLTDPTIYNQRGGDTLNVESGAKSAASETSTTEPIQLSHLPMQRVPNALSAVAMRALSSNPADRYTETDELKRDIEAYQTGYATSAEHLSTWGHLLLLIQRNRILTSAAVIILLISVGFVVQLAKSRDDAIAAEGVASQKELEARKAHAQSQLAVAEAALQDANAHAITTALEPVETDFRDTHWHYLWDARNQTTANYQLTPETRSLVQDPIHPGRFYAFTGTNGIQHFDEQGVGQRRLTTGVSGNALLAVSRDGRLLAIANRTLRQCEIIGVRSGSVVAKCTIPAADPQATISLLEFDPNGTGLLVALDRHLGVFLFDTTDGKLRWRKDASACATFHPEQSLIAVQDIDQTLLVNPKDGTEIRRFTSASVHDGSRMAFNSDGSWLAISDRNEFIHVIELRNGRTLFQFQPHDWLNDFAFSKDDRLLTLGNLGKTREERSVISVWDIPSRKRLKNLLGASADARTIQIHQESGIVLTDGSQPARWSIPLGTEFKTLRSSIADARGAAFLSEDKLLAPYRNAYLTLIDFKTSSVWQPQRPDYGIIAVHPDQQRYVFGSVFDRQGLGAVETFRPDQHGMASDQAVVFPAGLTSLKFSPNGQELIASFHWTQPAIFQADTLEKTAELPVIAKGGISRDAHFVTDDNIAFVHSFEESNGGRDSIHLWHRERSTITNSANHDRRINAVSATTDGTTLVIGGSDKVIRLLAGEDLTTRLAFRAHDDDITALCIHPSAPWVASASDDLSIRIWDMNSGKQLWDMIGPSQAVLQLAFSPTGRRLAAVERGGTVRVWEIPDSLP